MLFSLCGILAAGEIDPIAGASGWVGAGLLGLVLGWLLFKHLPEKDRQLETIMKLKDEQIFLVIRTHDEQDRTQQAVFQQALQKVVDHCEREMSKSSETVKAGLEEVRVTLLYLTGHGVLPNVPDLPLPKDPPSGRMKRP